MTWRKTSLTYSVASFVLIVAAAPAFAEAVLTDPSHISHISVFENRGSYKVFQGDAALGDIDIYIGNYGAFVSLDSLIAKLGYSLYRDAGNTTAQITFPDGSTLMFNFERDDYMSRGQVNSLQNNDYVVIGPYIFLNTAFLNQVFPVGFSVDQAARKLRIEKPTQVTVPVKQLEATASSASTTASSSPPVANTPQSSAASVDTMPPPDAAPRMPVMVDDLTQRGSGAYPKPDTEGQDVIHLTTAMPPTLPNPVPIAPTSPAPALPAPEPKELRPSTSSSKSGEDNDLIIQPKIKNLPTSDIYLEAFERGEILYLPFSDTMKLLEFPIRADAKTESAEGTFQSPPQIFSLSMATKEVFFNGESHTLQPADVVIRDKQMYVSSAALESWFDLSFKLRRQSMTLAIDSKTALPVEDREQRHRVWDKLLAVNKYKDNTGITRLENPYKAAEWPNIDVNLSSNAQKDSSRGNTEIVNSYSIQSGGDLGFLTTEYLMTGNDQTPVTNMRARAGRKDPDARLLGDLHATQFSVGDVQSPNIQNVSNDPIGRGALVTNKALDSSSGFDVHTFVGDALPGWEVELYQNKVLLQFQTVGGDGRYTFTNIPLLFGTNDFHIVLYGPQGQSEERVETILVGSSMLKPDKVEYTVSVNQKDKGTFDELIGTASTSATDSPRAITEMRYGVTDYLTAGASMTQTSVRETTGSLTDHRYVSGTADLDLGTAFVDVNMVRDVSGGWMGGVTALTSIEDISIRMLHKQFSNFVSETESPLLGQHKTDSEIDAAGQFYLPFVQDFNLGLRARRESFVDQAARTTYSTSFSKSFLGISFSNSISYVQSTTNSTLGTTGIQSRIGSVLVRADAQYQTIPEFQMQTATLTTEYRLRRDLTGQTRISKQLFPSESTSLSQSFTLNLDQFQLSLTGRADDQKNYAIGLNLGFSLTHDPVRDEWALQRQQSSAAGNIAARVFQDDNFNGIYDEGEKVIDEARPRINQLPLSSKYKDGQFISPVPPYTPMRIDVDTSTLKDPMLSPENKGYDVMARYGDTVVVDLPVVSTSEVDGVIKIVDDTAKRYALPDIVLELIDSQGNVAQRVVSESEGYFIFDKVKPGEYKISVPEEALKQYNASLITPITVVVKKNSDFYTDNNLLLYTKAYSRGMRNPEVSASKVEIAK